MASAGNSYSKIIDELNQNSYKTKRGKAFGKNSIHDILRNEKYAGVYVFNRAASSRAGKRNNNASKTPDEIIRVPGVIPAIISPEIWRSVQQKLDSRKQLSPRKRGTTMYILTGKVFCGKYGGTYTGLSQIAGKNKIKYHLYACNKRKRTMECSNRNIRKEILENFALDVIDEAFSSEEKISKLADKLEAGVVGPRLNVLAKEKETFETRLYEIENSSQVILDKDKIITHLGITKQVISDREDLESCKKIVDMYVEKVTIYDDRIEVLLKIEPDAYNAGGGEGNRTPVRKNTHKNFYQDSLYFYFTIRAPKGRIRK
jgi:site-specific DNA recombinase